MRRATLEKALNPIASLNKLPCIHKCFWCLSSSVLLPVGTLPRMDGGLTEANPSQWVARLVLKPVVYFNRLALFAHHLFVDGFTEHPTDFFSNKEISRKEFLQFLEKRRSLAFFPKTRDIVFQKSPKLSNNPQSHLAS
jgi:hypothetical protein